MTNKKYKDYAITVTLSNDRELRNQYELYELYIKWIMKKFKKIAILHVVQETADTGKNPHLHILLCLREGIKKQDCKKQYLLKFLETEVDSTCIDSNNSNAEHDYHKRTQKVFKICHNVPMWINYTKKELLLFPKNKVIHSSITDSQMKHIEKQIVIYKEENKQKQVLVDRIKVKTLNRSQFIQALAREVQTILEENSKIKYNKALFVRCCTNIKKRYLCVNSWKELPLIHNSFTIRYGDDDEESMKLIENQLWFSQH